MTKEQFKENLRVQEASADLAAPGGFGQVRKTLIIIKIAASWSREQLWRNSNSLQHEHVYT